jgi:hypothetical protein
LLEKDFMNIDAQAGTNPEGNIDRASLERNTETADFIERVLVNQQKLAAEIKPHYDFIAPRWLVSNFAAKSAILLCFDITRNAKLCRAI